MALSSQLFSSPSHMAEVVRSGFALRARMQQVYSEESFQQVLSIERKRARFANSAFLLLLVRIREESGSAMGIPRPVAALLFSGLRHCFREVDFVGWYREGRVAGAVLALGPTAPGKQALPRIIERVTQVLSRRLPLAASQRIDVRLIRLGRGMV